MEFIKNVAELIGALATITGAFFAVNKYTKGKILAWFQKPILDRIDKLENKHDNSIKEIHKRIDKIELEDLKQNIMNDKIPLEERLDCGERYIKLGGNGAIKVYVKELQEEYKKKLEEGVM